MPLTSLQIRELGPLAWKLSNRLWQTWLTSSGTGFSQWNDCAISRWRADATLDQDGFFFVVRDCETHRLWSPTIQPLGVEEPSFRPLDHRFDPRKMLFSCGAAGESTELEISVDAELPLEIRSLRIHNSEQRERQFEILSYLELVLQPITAFESHPTFSKMFIETGWDDQGQCLWGRRRPRSPHESPVAAGVFCYQPTQSPLTIQNVETCRATFIGRGNSLRQAHGLRQPRMHAGKWGGVLDPILHFRVPCVVPPNDTREVVFGLTAGDSLDDVLALAQACQRDVPRRERLLDSHRNKWNAVATNLVSPDPDADDELNFARSTATYIFSAPAPAPAPAPAAADMHEKPTTNLNASASSNPRLPPPSFMLIEGIEPQEEIADYRQFVNGWGGFSEDGRAYQMRLQIQQNDNKMSLPPMPWTHILANDHFGTICSERGSMSSWFENSREFRLTPWHNDPVCDPHGEAFLIQDLEAGLFWSPTPGPLPYASGTYEIAYEFGEIIFRHVAVDCEQEIRIVVPEYDAIKICSWRISNLRTDQRRLRLWSYLDWILGNGVTTPTSAPRVWREHETIFAQLLPSTEPLSETVAFAAWISDACRSPLYSTSDRMRFMGRFGSLESPRVRSDPLGFPESESDLKRAIQKTGGKSGALLASAPPCAAFQQDICLGPGESMEIVHLLGAAKNETSARQLVDLYRDRAHRVKSQCEVRTAWRNRLDRLSVRTPSRPVNILFNGWLMYQNLACRLLARSSYYQGGGAFGFRDQLQDSLALLHSFPERTRSQIVLHAAHQFQEGDVLHWWHPPDSRGVRTRFSDDLHWLPYACLEYVAITGDDSIWNEQVRFLTAEELAPEEQERFVWPRDSGELGSIWEHCRRSLLRAARRGVHGLPLMGCGDWNDGMSRVGAAGKGESVWLAFFLAPILERFAYVSESRGETAFAETCYQLRNQYVEAVEAQAWDGAWYRRAFLDDGTPLGSTQNSECQIDALVQAWAVLSGIARRDRVNQAMKEAEQRLVDREHGLIRLLDPPFRTDRYDVGYIRGYVPGIRENGGQYTHGILWFVRALAELGQSSKAWELIEMLTPIHQTRDQAAIATYRVEPYVLAADVYGADPHVGRGGWTWYTGSAGWMYRITLETLLGIRIERGSHLRIDPRIPANWPLVEVRYRIPGDPATTYAICIRNASGSELGVKSASVDGGAVSIVRPACDPNGVLVPVIRDGGEHQIEVIL